MNMTETHYLSMIIIGIGSFIFGILPMFFCFRMGRSYPFFLSLILCLGAGVLVATSLVHMLTEVQEKLQLYAQLYFCCGLLCLYTFDEISHYCLGINKLEVQSVGTEAQKRNIYGSTQNSDGLDETKPFLESSHSNISKGTDETFSKDKHFESSYSNYGRESQMNHAATSSTSRNNEQNEIILHSAESENWTSSIAAKTGLFISLLIHSILEGVSIGVQTKVSQILLILGAVSFHKMVLSFCLGLELHCHGFKKLQLLLGILIFSIGSPLGILLGMSVTKYENGIFGIDSELQAVAAGSLLYVALLEVLPRERTKWRSVKKTGGILQLIFLLAGFGIIVGFHFYFDPENRKNGNHSDALKKFIRKTEI